MGRPSDAGSVLVDALVGLGILAITLTLAAQAVQDGLRRSRRQEDARMAQLVARSQLASVGADIPLAPGRRSGADGPLLWAVTVTPDAGSGGLLSVAVEVDDARGARLATLRSLRTAGS